MKKTVYLILMLFLSIACVGKQSTKKEIDQPEPASFTKTDTLKFTSGIRSIFEDSKGNFWFGSLQEGVCLYDGSKLTYFDIGNGLGDNQVLSIQEDAKGHIWFATQGGVSVYDGSEMTSYSERISINLEQEWAKTEKDLWFSAGVKEGVYKHDGQKLTYLAFPDPKRVNSNNLYAVTGISKGKNNMLWMATYAGVFGYNGEGFTIVNDETLGLKRETGELHIRSILEDSKGRLWIGNNGIGVLLKEKDEIINFSEKQGLMHPTSSVRPTFRRGDKSQTGTLEHVFTITEDAAGNIWFGDRDAGVWKYDGKTMTNYSQKDGLTNDFATSIHKDQSGELWFGMADGSVFKFNGQTFERQF